MPALDSDSDTLAQPRLSVTVLNYNYARFLPECLDSILGQTFRDFELIVIDDCSQDESVQVIERYLDDPRVRLVAHKLNMGFARALIEGTDVHSRGQYLTVISADDLVLSPEAFARQMAAFDAHPSVVLSFSAFDRFIDGTGEVYESHRVFAEDTVVKGDEAFRRYLTERNFWAPHSGSIIQRAAYLTCGGYPDDVTVGLDFALFAALGLEGDFAYAAEPLHGYRNHEGQMSSSFAAARRNTPEFLRIIDRLCDRARAAGMPLGDLRRAAIQCQLAGLALQDAFSGRRRLALVRWWDAARRRPAIVLTSKEFTIALMRAVLGRRIFGMARRSARITRRVVRSSSSNGGQKAALMNKPEVR